jgi:DNA polymerase-3 subunit alpha
MVSDEENMERITMEVEECETKWISVLPPNVNWSLKHFTYVNDKTIRFWLKAIKWIWNWPIDRIIQVRKEVNWTFENLEHFIESCGKEVINKKSLYSLISSGAMDSFWDRASMLASISSMISFSRKDEKKKETNQIWLFDGSCDFEEKLELEEVSSLSFEEKLAWEKEVIWFWISGHPLDWLWRYCARRSQNIKKLKMDFEELLELDKKENPEKYEEKVEWEKEINESEKNNKQNKKVNWYDKGETCQVVWVITDFRKIFTKTWKVMMFLKCEWYDYDFEVVLFTKDVEKYAEKIDNFKMVIINWFLDINLKYTRKSIKPRDIQIASISQIRDQARDMWLLDEGVKRFRNKNLNETKEISNENDNDFDKKLEKKILDSKVEKKEKIDNFNKYIIDIPETAKKQDLVDLKNFLVSESSWGIEIFINLKWQQISTRINIDSLENVKSWCENKWKSQ